jgi:uncharacterized membrane protein YhdT
MDKKMISNTAKPVSNGSSKRQPGFTLPDNLDREVPNTNGVVIWPEKILNEIKMLEQFDKAQKRKEVHFVDDSTSLPVEEEFLVEKLGFSETFEFYLMLAAVAVIWWTGAYFMLKQHKFPFHRHYFEAAAIFLCPVIFIFVFFILVDTAYNYFDRKNKNKKDV